MVGKQISLNLVPTTIQDTGNWRNDNGVEDGSSSDPFNSNYWTINPCHCCLCGGRCPLSNWCLILGAVGALVYVPPICIAVLLRHEVVTRNLQGHFEGLTSKWGWDLKLVNIHTSLGFARTVQVYLWLCVIMLTGHISLIFAGAKMTKLGSLGHPITLILALSFQLVSCLLFQMDKEVQGIAPFWLFFPFPFETFAAICSIGLFLHLRAVPSKALRPWSFSLEPRSRSTFRDVDADLESLDSGSNYQTRKPSSNFNGNLNSNSKHISNRTSRSKSRDAAGADQLFLTSINNNKNNNNINSNSNSINVGSKRQSLGNNSVPRYIANLQPASTFDYNNLKSSTNAAANLDHNNNNNNDNTNIPSEYQRGLDEDRLFWDLEMTRRKRVDPPPRRLVSRHRSKHPHHHHHRHKHRSRSRRRRR